MTFFVRAALGALCLAATMPAMAASLSTHVLDLEQGIGGRGSQWSSVPMGTAPIAEVEWERISAA